MARSLRTVLSVVDLDEMVAFYRDLLGFGQGGGWDRGPSDRGALMDVAPGGVIEIVGHGPDFVAPDYHDLAIGIELAGTGEVDERYAHLRGHNIDVSSPATQPWGHYSTALRDPVGTEVVLYAVVSSS